MTRIIRRSAVKRPIAHTRVREIIANSSESYRLQYEASRQLSARTLAAFCNPQRIVSMAEDADWDGRSLR